MTIDSTKELEETYRETNWVKCPACGDEWSKLHPCYCSEKRGDKPTYLCVQCAESPKSIEWISEKYPISNILKIDNWKIRVGKYVPLDLVSGRYVGSVRESKEYAPIWRNHIGYVVINNGQFKFKFRAESGSYAIRIFEDGSEELNFSSDMISAWFRMCDILKERLQEPSKEEKTKKSWRKI